MNIMSCKYQVSDSLRIPEKKWLGIEVSERNRRKSCNDDMTLSSLVWKQIQLRTITAKVIIKKSWFKCMFWTQLINN